VRAIRAEADVTDANVTVGTPLFMSPEAMREPDRVDGRSDLYSLGAVAYFLLSGHHVFDGKTALDICARHMQDAPRSLSTLVPGIDPELEKIVLKCLEKEPANRFASARELCHALSLCPSRKDWTPDKARAWWTLHARLLHPVDPSNAYGTGELENRDTEQQAQ
jgi:serine/threonine-protein kinase